MSTRKSYTEREKENSERQWKSALEWNRKNKKLEKEKDSKGQRDKQKSKWARTKMEKIREWAKEREKKIRRKKRHWYSECAIERK